MSKAHFPLWIFRTANEGDMRLSVVVSTANIAGVANGDWALIAPFGEHPSPCGTYVQKFDAKQAARVVKTWNSITGTAARTFKNLLHGRGAKWTLPVWDGHPETDKQRWPVDKLLAEISEIRVGDAGLEGRVTWNAQGVAARTRGALYPSPLWWHWPPSGTPPTVYPELLESIGLVPTPNISGVPAWTQNATLAGSELAENQNQIMTPQQLAELRAALGLPETADLAACITAARTANASAQQLTERTTALSTANSAKAELETQLNTVRGELTTANSQLASANSQVTTLTTERDNLKTANTALTSANETLVKGVLDIAEKRGAIAPAERDEFKTKLATANTAEATLAELQTRKALNTTPVEINGSRVDLSTANSRATALQNAVQERMRKDNVGYDEAFKRCSQDPALQPLFAAMQQPAASAS